MAPQLFIAKVWSDENFPSHPRVQIGIKQEKGKDGKIIDKPIYDFFLKEEDAYIENGKVKCNFVGEYNKRNMRYSFHFDSPTEPNFFTHLIVATEFVD